MAEAEHEDHQHGATGPNGQWQAGDHYLHPYHGCVELTVENAVRLNEHEAKIIVAEVSRLDYDYTRPCPKCRCTFPADLAYHPEDHDCQAYHGKSEHMARLCWRCGYTWAENIP